MRSITSRLIGASMVGVGLTLGAASMASSLASQEDGEFLMRAAQVTRQEATDAQAALQSTRRPPIKRAARSIADDHARAGRELADLARRKGVAVDADERSTSDDSADRIGIASESPVQSDSARIAALLKTHEDAVALFHQEAVRGVDPDVRRFAEMTLPTLQRRLATLRALQDAYPESSAI